MIRKRCPNQPVGYIVMPSLNTVIVTNTNIHKHHDIPICAVSPDNVALLLFLDQSKSSGKEKEKKKIRTKSISPADHKQDEAEM